MTTRRRFSGEFKAKVALEASSGGGDERGFAKAAGQSRGEHEAEIRDLHPKIGELTVGRDFLTKELKLVSRERRRAIIRRNHPALSLSPAGQLYTEWRCPYPLLVVFFPEVAECVRNSEEGALCSCARSVRPPQVFQSRSHLYCLTIALTRQR